MKKRIYTILILYLISTITLFSQNIIDIPKSDASYSSIKKIVKKGYLSLINNKSFNGEKNISRKEMALILDKLLTKIDAQQLDLSQSELEELETLSKTFKNNLTNLENNFNVSQDLINQVRDEQTILNTEVTKIVDNVSKFKETKSGNSTNLISLKTKMNELEKNQENYLWIAVGGCTLGLLGILIN